MATQFPPGWDSQRDVIIVIDSDEALVCQWRAAGHARVLWFDPGSGVSAVPERLRGLYQLRQALADFPGSIAEKVCVVRGQHPLLTEALVQETHAACKKAIEYVMVHQISTESSGEQWVLHDIANLAQVARWPTVDDFSAHFSGRPCVIVAAGPSLMKNVEQLRDIQGRAILIVVSHALRAVAAAGVDADLSMVTDAGDLLYHFDDCRLERLGALVAASCVEPRIYGLPIRRFVTFASNMNIDGWAYTALGPHNPVQTGGSVATSAMGMAMNWGCNPIIIVGQDLAFRADGAYYAEGLADGDTRATVAADGTYTTVGIAGAKDSPVARLAIVPGYYGGEVHTSQSFAIFRQWFAETARSLQGHTRVINCTEGGAYIDAMEHMPLRAALQQLATDRQRMPIHQAMDAVYATFDSAGRTKVMRKHVQDMVLGLHRCVRAARACSAIATQARRDPQHLGKLTRAEKDLQRCLKTVPFVSAMRQRKIRTALTGGMNAQDQTAALAASLDLYRLIEEACLIAKPHLLAAQAELVSASPRSPR